MQTTTKSFCDIKIYAWSVCLFINIKYSSQITIIIKDALASWVFVVAKQQKEIDTFDQQRNLIRASCPRLRFQIARGAPTTTDYGFKNAFISAGTKRMRLPCACRTLFSCALILQRKMHNLKIKSKKCNVN